MAIASPCTKVCIIDPRSGLCLGCGRTLDEIAGWVSFTESERGRIMTELPQRRALHGISALETSSPGNAR